MVRIDCLIFGYRRLKIDPEFLSEATSILLRSSIPSRISSDGTVTIRERDFLKTQALFQGRISFTHSEPLGFYGKIKKLPHKITYGISFIISAMIVVSLSGLVWDIRVDGNVNLTDSEIAVGLSDCGFSVGDFWGRINRSEIESKYLEMEDKISWININKRGTVAYISVIEKEINSEKENPSSLFYSNVVAASDCVIEEITVKRGTAVVGPGDVVKKGDLLISGVLPIESGGGFCSAEGTVIGRVSESVTVNIDRNYEKKTRIDKKLYSCSINFFKFSLNIFKIYGNLTNSCDIIENEITYSLPGGHKLPFSVSLKYIPEYSLDQSVYTDEELVRIASDRLDALMASRLATSDLLKIKTYGEFTEKGYVMRSDITFLCEVGEMWKFEVG